MSLTTGVGVTWVPSTKMACLTAAPSGSQGKCEVTPRHLEFQIQVRFHGCMHTHICTRTCIHSHIHTQKNAMSDVWMTPKSSLKHGPWTFNSCQSALTPHQKEHGALCESSCRAVVRTLEKQRVEKATIGQDWALINPFNHKMEINHAYYFQKWALDIFIGIPLQ